MAREVVMPTGADAKVRSPGLVLLWTVITLGVYNAVWYYKINRELRDFGVAHGEEKLAKTNPVLSVLAVTLGALLIVPPIVSYWNTTVRIRSAQRACTVGLTEGWVIAICYALGAIILLPLLVIPPYVQGGLNRVWELYPDRESAPPPAAAGAELTAPAAGESPPSDS